MPSARAPPGIAFRARGSGNVVVIEAVLLLPPSTLLNGGGNNDNDGEEEEGSSSSNGGEMKVVGSILLELGETIMVARLACSDDARLLLVAYTDGTLSCLNVLIVDDDDSSFLTNYQ